MFRDQNALDKANILISNPAADHTERVKRFEAYLERRAKMEGIPTEEFATRLLNELAEHKRLSETPVQFYIGEDDNAEFPAIVAGPFDDQPIVPSGQFLYIKTMGKYIKCDL